MRLKSPLIQLNVWDCIAKSGPNAEHRYMQTLYIPKIDISTDLERALHLQCQEWIKAAYYL